MVVAEYESSRKKCTFVSPKSMSHNFFNYEIDILTPIKEFALEDNFK